MHQSAGSQVRSGSKAEDEEVDPELTPEEFKRLHLEVERLGWYHVCNSVRRSDASPSCIVRCKTAEQIRVGHLQTFISILGGGCSSGIVWATSGCVAVAIHFLALLPLLTGASALDKRERKKWQAAMLLRLGAKPEKSPRMPAAIGIGIAKKQAQREAQKLEEAFETGMAQRKGMGKKKRAAQSACAVSCGIFSSAVPSLYCIVLDWSRNSNGNN